MSYWLFQNNQVAGPYTPAELSALAAFGPDSLVCPEGRKGTQMGDWQRAEAVAELAEALARGRVPAGVAAASAPAPEREPAGMRELAVLGLLQERIAQLESSLRQVQDDLRGREAEISLLKSELAQRAAETSTLSAETSTLSQQGSSLKESVAAIQAKLAEPPPPPPAPVEDPAVASARSEHERAIQELRGQIQSLESKLAELNSAHGALERQVQSAPPPAPAPMQAPAPAPATVPMPKTAPTPADLLGAPPVR